MAALDFPASPVNGQIYDPGTGPKYQWDAATQVWNVLSNVIQLPGLIRVQVFVASGTYVPHVNMIHGIIECVGGGGGGGGVTGSASNQTNASGGGGGAYSKKFVTRTDIGASKPVVVGAGGILGMPNAGGGQGGTSSVGSLCLANGGFGGPKGQSGVAISNGGPGGHLAGAIGDICIRGGDGGGGQGSTNNFLWCGWGGASGMGWGGEQTPPLAADGTAGKSIGGGGSGGQSLNATSYAGGAGAAGAVIITEYCSA